MCDPVTITSLVLTAGSIAANTVANNNVASARAGALEAERQRQKGYEHQADATNTQAQNLFGGFQGQQQQEQQKLSDYFGGQTVAPPPAADALPPSASNLVVSEDKKQTGLADAYGKKTGGALASLRAFGQALGADSRQSARYAGELGQIDNFKTGSSAVLPYELDAASQSGNGLKSLGDVLGGLGQVGMMAALKAPGKISTTASSPVVTFPTVPGAARSPVGPLNNELSLGSLYG